ncbi:hypothetical protein L0B53_13885 [Vibrio sp. SS-MA-C1-2]|uniref:hypothetical protein n=1 Tax=Vibrio sp. SS-MA-C1-2 TaxID=2908646 RepID=UPI001F4658EF|nr:hypothetical protein [Vibrio sp. SS-MA-C1-2]UJF18104.1 hypothetical protein L0B53_13885 [Vibrio sp. SS-MA-C1-2]
MPAQKLTKGRLIQIIVMLIVLICLYIWKSPETASSGDNVTTEKVTTHVVHDNHNGVNDMNGHKNEIMDHSNHKMKPMAETTGLEFKNGCKMVDGHCIVKNGTHEINFHLDTKRVKPMQPVELVVSGLSEVPKGGIIEGVSMDMGKIPLQFTINEDNQVIANFSVPACMHPTMDWKMEIAINDKNYNVVFTADGQVK